MTEIVSQSLAKFMDNKFRAGYSEKLGYLEKNN